MQKIKLSENEICTICLGLMIALDDLLIKIESIDSSEDSGKNFLSGPDFEKAVLQSKFDSIQEILVRFNDL